MLTVNGRVRLWRRRWYSPGEGTNTPLDGWVDAVRLLNYVSERREMIRYPEFVAKGWQIGSGPTEATCKTLTARLKGSGMRWDADNAEAVMGLEALYQSGQWDAYGKVSYGKRVNGSPLPFSPSA